VSTENQPAVPVFKPSENHPGNNGNIAPPNQQQAPVVPPTPTPPQPDNSGNPDAVTAAIAALTAALGGIKQEGVKAPDIAATIPNPAKGDAIDSIDLQELEDPILRSMATAISMGAPADFSLNRAIGNAIDRGDVGLIDRAYLIDKFGRDAQTRITIAEGIVNSVVEQSAKVAQQVYASAGGEANWAAATTAFNTAAPAAFKQVVAQMLNSGVREQITAASQMVVEFSKSQGFVPTNNSTIQTGGVNVATGQALNKAEYQAELKKLSPYDKNFEQQRHELFARRQLGKSLGKN
jgi:hypothetical protein